ncbi:MAG TPA: hypothetical protein VJP86_06405 [Vicinamibacterales bacterium]|nr:hypothetical protein [Vicinamibacterales bacterium]
MTLVISAEGPVLERVLEIAHALSPLGLSRRAFAQFDAAMMRTAWGRRHQRRFALVKGSDVLASAVQYDLAAVLDEQPVRVCGLGEIFPQTGMATDAPARELVDRLLEQAARDGATMALRFADTHEAPPGDAGVVPMTDVEIAVAEPSRRGAPMTMIRGGEERDLAAMAAMGRVRASQSRFYLDRDADFVQHAITRRRVLAGLGAPGACELHFFIAEEGITAAAYVVVSVAADVWTIEECGDRDPSGARVGAMLQALIARQPVERRPTIRAWLPRGFVPPQVAIVSATPSSDVMVARALGRREALPRLSSDEVLYWRGDIF